MRLTRPTLTALVLFLAASAASGGSPATLGPVPEAKIAKITAALPQAAPAKPAAKRKVLVFWLCEGFYHGSIPVVNECLKLLGQKTGAYATVTSNDMKVFSAEGLAGFDAIVFNNTTGLKFKDPAARKALLDFVRGGKGIVGIHTATDNFYDFPEAAEMMGGLFDGHPWTAGGTWAIKVDEPDHPLNASFGGKGFKIRDEIYQLRGPFSRSTHRVLLSLDMSDPATASRRGQKRADRDNPISIIRACGKGRAFYTALGHNDEVFWNQAVVAHLLAGMQYALGDLAADDAPLLPKDHWATAAAYTPGQSRRALTALEAEIRGLKPASYPAVEKQLLALLASPQATPAAKQWACEQLRRVASEASTDPLLRLVQDKPLAAPALMALQGIPGQEVSQGLIDVLAKVTGPQRVGVISALGARREARAAKPLAGLVGDKDTAVASAAIRTLGQIGTTEALKALSAIQKHPAGQAAVSQARVVCAGHVADAGDKTAAAAAFRKLAAKGHPLTVRVSAMHGLLRADPDRGTGRLLEAMRDPDPAIAASAVKLLGDSPEIDIARALARALAKQREPTKLAILAQLPARIGRRSGQHATQEDRTTILNAILTETKSTSAPVRVAAIQAIGRCGGTESLERMLAIATGNDGQANVARAALAAMPGDGVDGRLVAMLRKPDAARAPIIITALDARKIDHSAAAELISLAKASPDAATRKAALRLLTKIATAQDLPALATLLAADPTATAQRAVLAAARDEKDPAKQTAPLVAALGAADAKAKPALVTVLGKLPSAPAQEALTALLKDTTPEVRRAAVEALAAWPSAAGLDDLLRVARLEKDDVTQTLAVRGIIRLTVADAAAPADTRVKTLAEAITLARSTEERRTALAALTKIPSKPALALAQSLAGDKDLAAQAHAATTVILQEICKPTPVAASHKADWLPRMLDRNIATRWETTKFQTGDEWFVLKMPEDFAIATVVLDTTQSRNDWPRGYKVFLSKDGKAWGKPVAAGVGAAVTRIALPTPVTGGFIKIAQTGKWNRNWWSIHELFLEPAK